MLVEKAIVLFNPMAGRGAARPLLEAVRNVLSERFSVCEVESTLGPGSAGEQVRLAIAAGYTHVVVCGGDGTLFEALQGVARTGIALGVLPLGTGNVVARDLGLSMDPVRAARQLVQSQDRLLPLGFVETADGLKYFLASAGVGLHAELMRVQKLAVGGRAQYYAHGLRMLLRSRRAEFLARITTEDGQVERMALQELLVTRVGSYGGLLKRWKPGLSLVDDGLAVTIATKLHYVTTMMFLARAVAGWRTDFAGGIRTMRVSRVECAALDPGIPVQADGNALRVRLPVAFGSVADGVWLMLPHSFGE